MSRLELRTSARRRAATSIAVLGLVVIGCTPTASTKLLTDPKEIAATSIRATTGLSFVRIHVDAAASMGGLVGGGAGGDAHFAVDADVDLARRQMAGRMTTQLPAAFGVNGGQANQVQEFISLTNASYSRTGGAGRWTKFSIGGVGAPAGPTNAQIAGILESLLSNPNVTLALGDAATCSLGTCYHVTATVDGTAAVQAILGIAGSPPTGNIGITIPPLVFELLIDQATGVLSEARLQTTVQGTSLQAAVLFSNPDLAVQIVAPPAALVDDISVGGGFGPGPTTAPVPVPAESSTP
jgi:hypothetical protein